jgi:hypothetical protein
MNGDKFAKYVVVVGIPIMIFIVVFEIVTQVTGMQAKVQTVDSLQTEIFILKTEIGRYELGVEYLKEEDSVAAKKLQDYIDNQTE